MGHDRLTHLRGLRAPERRDAGMSLVEVMIAVVVIVMAVTALSLVVVSGIRTQVLTERVDRATGTTQVIVSKAREVDFANLGYYTTTDSTTTGAVVLPINAIDGAGAVGATLNETPVILGTLRPTGTPAFTPHVTDLVDEGGDGADFRVTTDVTWVPNADGTPSTAKRVTVVTKWGVTPANLAAACDTDGIRCTTQSMVRTATASDLDPVTKVSPTSTCLAGAQLICEAYIRSGRVLDGATMASVNDFPQQISPVDLYVRTASKATSVKATWTWLQGDGTVSKTVTASLAGGTDGTRWAYTVPADPAGASTNYKGDIRPGAVKVTFNASSASGAMPAVERGAFWSYAPADGADVVTASIAAATTWCSPLGSGTPVSFTVQGHSIGFDATPVGVITKSAASADSVDVVFTSTVAGITKTVTKQAVVDPASIVKHDVMVNGITISGQVDATWTVASPPPTERCDNRGVTVIVHRAGDQTHTPIALRLPPTTPVTPALLTPSLTLTLDPATGVYTASWSTPAGATGFNVETTIGGAATTTSGAATTSTGTLTSGQAMTLRVQATTGWSSSAWSTLASATRVPAAVTAISVARVGDIATFSWAAVPGATTYRIGAAVPPAGALSVDQAGTSFTLTVDRGLTGYINVYAGNAGGWSAVASSLSTTPLFDALPMAAGWVDYASGYTPARYTKTSSGAVMLSGLIRGGSTANGTVLGTLPVGYRPSGSLIFGVAVGAPGGDTLGRIDVSANGQIILYATTSTGWTSLDGINFLSAAGPAMVPLPLTNGWTNYGAWAAAASAQDAMGRTWVQGLLTTGNTAAETPIAPLPAAQRPSEYLHLPQYGSPGHSTLSYSSSVLAKVGGTAGWMPIQGMFYAAGQGAWTALPLQSGWVVYPGYATPQYTKSADGMVTVKGLIKGGAVASGTVIATLPPGHRPSATVIGRVTNNLAFGRIDILANGDIVARAGVQNAWLALESLSFMAEQ